MDKDERESFTKWMQDEVNLTASTATAYASRVGSLLIRVVGEVSDESLGLALSSYMLATNSKPYHMKRPWELWQEWQLARGCVLPNFPDPKASLFVHMPELLVRACDELATATSFPIKVIPYLTWADVTYKDKIAFVVDPRNAEGAKAVVPVEVMRVFDQYRKNMLLVPRPHSDEPWTASELKSILSQYRNYKKGATSEEARLAARAKMIMASGQAPEVATKSLPPPKDKGDLAKPAASLATVPLPPAPPPRLGVECLDAPPRLEVLEQFFSERLLQAREPESTSADRVLHPTTRLNPLDNT
jgi:hypothetical protein